MSLENLLRVVSEEFLKAIDEDVLRTGPLSTRQQSWKVTITSSLLQAVVRFISIAFHMASFIFLR